ncbi:HPr kinase/phosphorylase [Tropicimonas sediminicola]|uniref:Hpr(Ser) kinase/phosphatase n=1 Tax=Tropicimonas sediminicola TaxID=1031541 RepID=A0A239I3Q5_9RHOB|nr:hypothetical protein [Tropicimonas sediminicola]SNS88220.1 Hpr(Ser) kinase/phosphatase [Tropicimonas sediminicola]
MSAQSEIDTAAHGAFLDDDKTLVRASCVAMDGRALLILGGSGSGKSSLALDLVGLGATLVSDDGTFLERRGDILLASPPDSIAGRIEARHIGILSLPFASEARVILAIDLDREETDRLPPLREITLMGQTIPLLHRPPRPVSASGLLQCLLERRDTP